MRTIAAAIAAEKIREANERAALLVAALLGDDEERSRPMAFTQAQLDSLETAIASGTTRVSYQGRSVEYASLDVMLRVRDIIRRALGLTPAASATVVVAHDRGFPGPATWGDDGLFSGF